MKGNYMQIVELRLRPSAGDELTANTFKRVEAALAEVKSWTRQYPACVGGSRQECFSLLNAKLRKEPPVSLGHLGVKAEHFEYRVAEADIEDNFMWTPTVGNGVWLAVAWEKP